MVTFSPDGRYVASGAIDGSVDVWGLTPGTQVWSDAHGDDVDTVATSPDGTRVASASRATIRVWSADGKALIPPVKIPGVRVDRLAFAEDGASLVALVAGSLFRLDLAHDGSVVRLADSRAIRDPVISSRHVAAYDRERRAVRVWRAADGSEASALATGDAGDLALDSTGDYLAARQGDGRDAAAIHVWAIDGAREIGHTDAPRGATFALSPGGRFVAIARTDADANRNPVSVVDGVDASSGSRVVRVPASDEARLVGDPTSNALFIVGETDVRVVSVPDGGVGAVLDHELDIRALRASPEAGVLATISGGLLRIWNHATGTPLASVDEAGYVRDARFLGRDGRYLVTGDDAGRTIVWRWKTKELRAEACARAGRNLTQAEWARYLGTAPYRPSCGSVAEPPAGQP
jgi:WD40 repeat protein